MKRFRLQLELYTFAVMCSAECLRSDAKKETAAPVTVGPRFEYRIDDKGGKCFVSKYFPVVLLDYFLQNPILISS